MSDEIKQMEKLLFKLKVELGNIATALQETKNYHKIMLLFGAKIEKAEKWDKQFEGLRVKDVCKHIDTLNKNIINRSGKCKTCGGEGQILRELTEDEKEEFITMLMSCVGCDWSLLKSGSKVVRR